MSDWRNITSGNIIPTKRYSDQPYVVRTDDGAWLCVVTTGSEEEGQSGQHVVCVRSTDMGRTWSAPVEIEPPDGPEASYAVLLKTPYGRIYCFYNHNTDNLRFVKADDPPFKGGLCSRVDSLGHFVFKYSDDNGLSWSDKRYDIPQRVMDIDRRNPYGGEVKFFWNVGKPFVLEDVAYVPLHKVGGFGHGFFTRSEGVLLRSANLLRESDPERIIWGTLPDGDFGLRTPTGGGAIAEEQSCVPLSDGSLYCVYRTVDGHPACCYSRDGGHTWSEECYKSYADGRLMKHPRAANFVWKCCNGKYLYWFHNHGGTWYDDRNPVWLCGGVEADSPEGRIILWSQPEILLYDDDTHIRISYPDLLEQDGRYFVTETQKNLARTHEIPALFLEKLWGQLDSTPEVSPDFIAQYGAMDGGSIKVPKLPVFLRQDNTRSDYGTRDNRSGFTLELWADISSFGVGRVLFSSMTPDGKGITLLTSLYDSVELTLGDGRCECRWRSDAGSASPGLHHIAVIVDGGAKIVSFVIDGRFNDGGAERQFGWGRFSPTLRHANGREEAQVGDRHGVSVKVMRIYARALMTSEAVGNYKMKNGGIKHEV
ncbi:MAG: sialidase family protein [Eubacteriales bacterium]